MRKGHVSDAEKPGLTRAGAPQWTNNAATAAN